MTSRNIPKIRQLEALMSAIASGSMTAAASNLGISQPAISRLLSDLAKDFDFQLFEKRDGQLRPSQEIQVLEPDIRRVLELMRHIADVSADITRHKAGHLRIACLPGFATSHLPIVVANFLKDRPGVTMTIEPDRPERILEWMVNEQYDLGITGEFFGHPAVEQIALNLRTVCIFPSGHRLENLEEISPSDLTGEPMIHTRKDSIFFSQLSNRFQMANCAINSHVEVRQFTAACKLICNGIGVSVVSELDAVQYSHKGLSFRPFKPSLPHRISLVRPVHKAPSMLTIDFMEHFQKSVEVFRC